MSCAYCTSVEWKRRDLISLEHLGSCSSGYFCVDIERDDDTGAELLAADISQDDVGHMVRRRINFCPVCGRDLRKEGE